MNIFGISDKGRYRSENQDSFSIMELDDAVLAVVCDGMGGAAAGLLASDMATGRFISYMRNGLVTVADALGEDLLRQATDAANRQVYNVSCTAEEYAGMGTTLVGALFTDDRAIIVNVGDSRAYRVARDGIIQITRDHSYVQRLVDQGKLTQAQARRHPRRNIITRAVGSEEFVTSDIFSVPMREGDTFLLCSDGLTNAVEEAEIHRLILAAEDAESACRALVDTALGNDARDNVTVIVAKTVKGGGENG